MPSYSYSGITFSGQSASGVAKAHDVASLSARLRSDGVLLLEASRRRARPFGAGRFSRRRFDSTMTRYFRHLSTLVGAGVPLSRALDGLAERAQGAAWKQIITEVACRVRNGSSFADALSSSGETFVGVAIPMIAAGESGGTLPEVLERIAVFRERREAISRKVRGALIYPAVVSLVAVGVIWIMLTHVVPVFAQMYANLNAELPRPTRILLAVSGRVRSWWWAIPVLLGLAAFAIAGIRRRPRWRLRVAHWGLQAPFLGDLLGKTAVARVARTAATLLENGVSLLPALRTASRTAGNCAIEHIFLEASDAVELGRPLSEPLAAVRHIPPLAGQLLSTGEETANLGRMFGKLADFYEAEADAAVGVVTAVIEPALVVVMGIIVAGILIALYLPMFEVLGKIGG